MSHRNSQGKQRADNRTTGGMPPSGTVARTGGSSRTGGGARTGDNLAGGDHPDVFVNPYTFVPFPDFPDPTDRSAIRDAPAGHALLALHRYSGSVEVELTARSPLLLRGIRPGEEGTFPRRPGGGTDGRGAPFVPGSSLAGAVRSLHEALAGGCLRVFDAGFRPGYRDVVRPREGAHWHLARVDAIDRDGRPTRLNICDRDEVWVPVQYLARDEALGSADAVRTGATVHLGSKGERVAYGKSGGRKVPRWQLTDPTQVRQGERWVVLVTDTGARPGERNAGTHGWVPATFYCPVGRLSSHSREVRAGEMWDKAWGRFLDAVDGTDDMRRARKEGKEHDEKPALVPVHFPPRRTKNLGLEPRLVGQRVAARRRLFNGQVVWVRLGEKYEEAQKARPPVVVEEISLSQVWRHSGGEHTAGERVPEVLHPCQDDRALCPTCRVFGSAETDGSDTAAAGQRSYRGHLRFSDGLLAPVEPMEPAEHVKHGEHADSDMSVEPIKYALPPLSAPRPGAGQFYLANPAPKHAPDPEPQADPLREWGSAADARGRRNLRGRKQYWLTGRPDRRPYFRATADRPEVFHELYTQDGGGENKMLTHAEAVPAGARFRFTVHYENLDLAELGGVLAALDPQYILGHLGGNEGPDRPTSDGETIGFALGGGRPLGFGTCTSRITALRVETALGRYAGQAEDEDTRGLGAERAVAEFTGSVPEAVRRIWKPLCHALTLDRAAPHLVWYPPAGALPEDGALPAQHLMPSFQFWKESRGFRGEHKINKQGVREKEKETLHPLTSLPLAGTGPQELEVTPDDDQRRHGAKRLRGTGSRAEEGNGDGGRPRA